MFKVFAESEKPLLDLSMSGGGRSPGASEKGIGSVLKRYSRFRSMVFGQAFAFALVLSLAISLVFVLRSSPTLAS
jgi:hypothetical protein